MQRSGNFSQLIERLHKSLIDLAKNFALSFRKLPNRTSRQVPFKHWLYFKIVRIVFSEKDAKLNWEPFINDHASLRICISNKEIKSKTSGKIYAKLKYEIFLQWNTKFFLQKVLDLLSFFMSSANIVAEIQFKLLNERVLSNEEPWTCEYATLLQSFHRGTLNIHWHIAQKFLAYLFYVLLM